MWHWVSLKCHIQQRQVPGRGNLREWSIQEVRQTHGLGVEQRVGGVYVQVFQSGQEVLSCPGSFYFPSVQMTLNPSLLYHTQCFFTGPQLLEINWDQGSNRAPSRVCFGHSDSKDLNVNFTKRRYMDSLGSCTVVPRDVYILTIKIGECITLLQIKGTLKL